MDAVYTLHRGTAPLLVSLPHDGCEIPAPLHARLTPDAGRLPDTDWHVSRLYAFARELGASVLVPRYSRYVIDLNRPPDDLSLYPGQNTTGLCPTTQFSGAPVYRDGQAPSPDEVQQRVETYWRPYHAAIEEELARLRAGHGRVLLWEGHSIRSVVPFLFDGTLPDINLGTAGGASCAAARQHAVEAVLRAQTDYSWVANGRFKGGYITRHYADPAQGIDAIQLELAQARYMDEESFEYDERVAGRTQAMIRRLMEAALAA